MAPAAQSVSRSCPGGGMILSSDAGGRGGVIGKRFSPLTDSPAGLFRRFPDAAVRSRPDVPGACVAGHPGIGAFSPGEARGPLRQRRFRVI